MKGYTEIPEEVVKCYLEPHRKYHNLEHIYNGLATIRMLSSNHLDRKVLEIAWWFHDSVYVVGAKNNEQKSAEYASHLGYDSIVQSLVANTIYPHTISDDYIGSLQCIINDADLCGLGYDWSVYIHHSNQIREEYSIYSDKEFWEGRLIFLSHLIETQKPLFKTILGHKLWERKAQANILTEIKDIVVLLQNLK